MTALKISLSDKDLPIEVSVFKEKHFNKCAKKSSSSSETMWRMTSSTNNSILTACMKATMSALSKTQRCLSAFRCLTESVVL